LEQAGNQRSARSMHSTYQNQLHSSRNNPNGTAQEQGATWRTRYSCGLPERRSNMALQRIMLPPRTRKQNSVGRASRPSERSLPSPVLPQHIPPPRKRLRIPPRRHPEFVPTFLRMTEYPQAPISA
jgi:hypothetical protein